MTNQPSITGTNHNGKTITVATGDVVRFMRLDGIHAEDTVRVCFIQHDSLGNSYPAVVLTEHSWTPLSSIIDTVVKDAKAVQMHRSHKIDGVMVSFSRSIIGWVACFGPDRFVSFRQPIKNGVWVARQRMALEPLCTATTLTAAVRLVKARYDAHDHETEQRIAARLKTIASDATRS